MRQAISELLSIHAKGYLALRLASGVLCTPLSDSLERPGIPCQRP